MHLAEAAWTDADDEDVDLAVLPVGSTEQHGPHAALGTDFLAADAIAAEAADRYDGVVAVAPPIPVGVAEEHRQFTGTLWVSEDTFRAYVRETVESLLGHGWDHLVVVNGHGGNTAALGEVCGAVTRHTDGYAVAFTWFDAIDVDDADVDLGHGGAVETSLLQHCFPDLVDEDRLETAADGAADGWGEFHSGTNLAYDTAEFSENGAVGDPSAASPELGERLFDEASAALVSLFEAVVTRDGDRPGHR
jgi:creatinine amidohydrolase